MAKSGLKLGTLAARTGQLLWTQRWPCLIVFFAFNVVPQVVLGELMDTPRDALFRFGSAHPLGIQAIWMVPTALFYAVLTSWLMGNRRFGAATLARATALMLVLLAGWRAVQLGISYLDPGIVALLLGYAVWLVLNTLFAVLLPSVIATPGALAPVVRAWRLAQGARWRLALVAVLMLSLGGLSSLAERAFLTTFQIADGTVMDWVTTIIQQVIASLYQLLDVVVSVAAFQLLVQARDGAPAAETAEIFR